jgi:hypothetical protein
LPELKTGEPTSAAETSKVQFQTLKTLTESSVKLSSGDRAGTSGVLRRKTQLETVAELPDVW